VLQDDAEELVTGPGHHDAGRAGHRVVLEHGHSRPAESELAGGVEEHLLRRR
jgi:hypothetical protein